MSVGWLKLKSVVTRVRIPVVVFAQEDVIRDTGGKGIADEQTSHNGVEILAGEAAGRVF
jgi:hypothetical protein